MLNNKYIILTAYHNADKYLAENIKGSLNQEHDDVGIIFIDDGSYDDSEKVLFDHISLTQSGDVWTGKQNNKDIIYIKNETRNGCPALSQKLAVDNYVANTGSICCIVDGDDYVHTHAISQIDRDIEDHHLMFCSNVELVNKSGEIYGSADSQPIRESGYQRWTGATPYPHPRQQGFFFHHFRGFRKILSDNVNTGRSFYSPTGDLMRPASDVAYFLPMIDMAGTERILTSNCSVYNYRNQLSTNDMQLHNWQQSRNSKFVTHAFSGVKWHDGSQTLEEFCRGINIRPDKLHANNAFVNISGTRFNLQTYTGLGLTGTINDLTFSGLFGGTELVANNTYNFPSSAERWGGFSILESDIFPRGFPNGATIKFTGSAPSGDVSVKFRFEKSEYPDFKPLVESETTKITGTADSAYSVEVPIQDPNNVYHTFILYLLNRDTPAKITNLSVQHHGGQIKLNTETGVLVWYDSPCHPSGITGCSTPYDLLS